MERMLDPGPMRERVAAWFVVAAMVATTACGALLGAHDPIEVAADAGAPDAASAESGGPVTPEVACGDLYDGLAANDGCPILFAPLPNSHRDRFVKVCAMPLAAPGAGGAVAAVETCATALKASPCVPLDAACSVPAGALPSGAACGSSLQCAGGFCDVGQGAFPSYARPSLLDLLPRSLGACGVCADELSIGAMCSPFVPGTGGLPRDTARPCVDGARCTNQGPPGPSPTGPYVCESIPPLGDIGAPCGGAEPIPCKNDLWCSSYSGGTCGPLAGTGEPCNVVPCKGQLVCATSAGGVSTCVVGKGLGEACALDGTVPCARAVCAGTPRTCQTATLEPPGASCDYSAFQCAAGFCQYTGPDGGVCTVFLADGQPCSPGSRHSSCDDFATCGPMTYGPPPMTDGGSSVEAGSPPDASTGPVCVLFDPGSCR
jgi:hypothetical protein